MTLSSRPLAVVVAQPFYKYASQGNIMDKSTTTKRGGQQPFGDLTPYNNNNNNNSSNYYCGGDYRREEEPAGWPHHHYVKKENSENHHVMIKSNKGSTKEGFHESWDRSYPTAPYYYKHNSAHNNSSNNNVMMPRGGKYYQQEERTASQYYVPTTSTEPYCGNPYYDRASTPSSCCYQQYMVDKNENRPTTKLSSGYSAYHTSYPRTTKPFAHQPTRPTEKLHQSLTSSSEDNRRPIGSTTSYHHHSNKTNNMCFPHPLPVSNNNDKKNNEAVGNNNNDDDETALQSLDIVCGRGAPKNFHYGNQVFLELVKDYQTKYFCAKRSDKADIAMKILDIVKARGGRFVRRQKKAAGSSRSSSCWEPISDKSAYERVCQALRDGTPDLQRQVLSTLRSSSSSSSSLSAK